jgi:hypothetical protein
MTFDPNKSLKLIIDSSKIDSDLTDFPVLIVLSSGTGITNYDTTDAFDELNQVTLVSGIDVLLLHMDDDGLTDSSPSNHAITKYGDVVKSSSESKFGGYSAYFDGSGDYLSIPHSEDWMFGTDDFTMDCWINPQQYSVFQRLICRHNGSTGWLLTINTNNTITYANANGVSLTSTSTIVVGAWMHVAVVRHGNRWDLYINGVSEVSATNANSSTDLNPYALQIGRLDTQPYDLNAYLDEVRISKGIARWTSNFIPPTGSYESSWVNRKKIAITTMISGVETQCPIEIESWNADNEQAYLWTKVPTIYSGIDTELMLYYDSTMTTNSGYVGDTGEAPAQQVWDNNFVGVWHMAQDPYVSDILDSTSNVNNAIPQAGLDADDFVDGRIGKSVHFDGAGTTDRLNLPTSSGFEFGQNEFTIEHIVYPQGNGSVFCNYETSNNLHAPFFDSATSARVMIQGVNEITDVSFTGIDFQQFFLIRDGNSLKAYVNNAQSGTTGDVTGVSIGADTKNYIGSSDSASHAFTGIVDELRVSNIKRDASWRTATYYSNWNSLITFRPALLFCFSDPMPIQSGISYGYRHLLSLITTLSGDAPSYSYDAVFYADGVQIGSTVSGTDNGDRVTSTEYLMTPIASGHSWYVVVTSSGFSDTSLTYYFDNKFLCAGYTEVDGVRTSGIPVRLYRRDDGSFIGEDTSSGVSGTFQISTDYTGHHYAIALYPLSEEYNAQIYDFLAPTIS